MDARDVLATLAGAGFAVTAEGDRIVVRPGSRLTDEQRAAVRAVKGELLALLAGSGGGWTDADIARFLDRRARLMRWGWPAAEAEALAERLVIRDRSSERGDTDDRASCTDCRHYQPGRCHNHRHAGLHGQDVGRDLASLLQRCAGFEASSDINTPTN
jgi:hypothetical protein